MYLSARMIPEELAQLQRLGLGSMARKVSGDEDLERKIRDDFHAQAPVPLLITADLEGSRMSQPGGVFLPNPLGIAAVDDVSSYRASNRDFGDGWLGKWH